ncbi:hypothetical protein ADIARSV_2909 [Arcticibacter svalbardensis MN12-7]|uniref:Uncharacterized protein n=1 Tax=Arcticibacter svalbardensis MN12-7 TaxID=1150600 RepID=R9GQB3_9SPHI|nr:hypothetical protein [Arcticibacter svalbardensis]EOR93916.1 hypothetical protein ADIARSV_2909 [Arcticibacter svalbardensis MN12-7]
MVVQRESNNPVWGWANPNEKITITTSWGAKSEGIAKVDSTWKMKLKTPNRSSL